MVNKRVKIKPTTAFCLSFPSPNLILLVGSDLFTQRCSFAVDQGGSGFFFFPSFSSWLLWNHELPATSRYQEIMKKSSPSSGNKPPTAVEQSTRPITCARKFSCYSTTTTNFRRQEYLWNGLTRQQTASRLHFDWLAYWWLLQSLQLP